MLQTYSRTQFAKAPLAPTRILLTADMLPQAYQPMSGDTKKIKYINASKNCAKFASLVNPLHEWKNLEFDFLNTILLQDFYNK